MGLNVSNAQIAKELDVSERTVHDMCDKLRRKVFEERPAVQLSGEVELDEVYVVAGHKGHPDALKKGTNRAATALKGGQRKGHTGERETAHSGYDRTRWGCGYSDVGECSAENDPTDHPAMHQAGHPDVYRRIRYLRPHGTMGLSPKIGVPQQGGIRAGRGW